MARAPDPRIEQAKAMYLEGEKLVEIASQLNLPEGTVRRWKCTHKWDNERSDKKNERSRNRKRGAQPKNKNAVGNNGGAPEKIRMQLLRESLRLSFLIAWIWRSSAWCRQFQRTSRRFLCRRYSF